MVFKTYTNESIFTIKLSVKLNLLIGVIGKRAYNNSKSDSTKLGFSKSGFSAKVPSKSIKKVKTFKL